LEHIEHLLGAYHDGELPGRMRKHVEVHLDTCAQCRAALLDLEALSRMLALYRVPDPANSAQQFQRQVMLRLSRRGPAAPAVSGWLYVIPLALSCVLVGLLALIGLPGVLRVLWLGLEWAGVAPGLLLKLPVAMLIPREAVTALLGVGSLAWGAVLYAALLLVFGSYVGWVGVLWRTQARSRSGKER
jgi:anti-sigma factor RsiW